MTQNFMDKMVGNCLLKSLKLREYHLSKGVVGTLILALKNTLWTWRKFICSISVS